jgi:hypothetical protein
LWTGIFPRLAFLLDSELRPKNRSRPEQERSCRRSGQLVKADSNLSGAVEAEACIEGHDTVGFGQPAIGIDQL